MTKANLSGLVFGLLLLTSPAIGQPAETQPDSHSAIALDPAAFDKFVGFYSLTPKAVFTVSRDGEHFFAQLARERRIEIFPESPTSFFAKAVPEDIRFELDASGQVTHLVLHQNGRDLPAPRIDEATARTILTAPIGDPMPRRWPVMAGITPRTLTRVDGETFDAWPCFSPDGRTVLFSRSTDRGKNWILMRVPAIGGEAMAFTQTPLQVSATRADWSVHSRLIAFTATDGRSNSLWITKGDGSDAHAVTAAGLSGQVFYPSWYPDGKSLAVQDAGAMAIKRVDVGGGAAVVLTNRSQVLTGMPRVSPDGKWIVFAGQRNEGQAYDQKDNVLWLTDGSAAHTLETPPLPARTPAWSPDGKRIAFASDRGNGEGRYALFAINRDGSGLVQVTDYGLDAIQPVFSVDGQHMVYMEGRPGGPNGIAVIDLP